MAPQLLEEIRKRRVGGKLAAPAISRPYNSTRASFRFRGLNERAPRAINSPARFPYSTGYAAGYFGGASPIEA